MKSLKHHIGFKVATILIIVLLLLIPTAMIKNLIAERETTQNQAIQEVSSKGCSHGLSPLWPMGGVKTGGYG